MTTLLSIADVAKTLAVSDRTVARLCTSGDLPAYRVRHQWRIKPEDLAGWMRANKSGSKVCSQERQDGIRWQTPVGQKGRWG